MDINFLGHSSFKIKGKTASIVTDPFDPQMVGLKYPQQEAEIVTISHPHQDHNQANLVSNTKKIIEGPGEYEISGVSIIGLSTYHDNTKGQDRGKNTIYVFEIDGFRVAHLGDLGHMLSSEEISEIGDVDILMIPVGGVYTIDAVVASELASKIAPHVIIPMHFRQEGMSESFSSLDTTQAFVSNLGLPAETLPKLVVRDPAAWSDEQQQVVILETK